MTTKKINTPASTMEELLAKTGYKVKGFQRSQKIEATLLEIGKNYATFDVGGKAEGILVDTYFDEAKDYVSNLKSGDTVEATVINPETPDGRVLLSLRHAAQESIWDRLEEIKKTGKIVNVFVTGASGKGLTVEFESVTGFIPQTHIGRKLSGNLETLSDKELQVKIVETDKAKKRIVFSEKAVSEAESMELIEKALGSVKEGDIYEGEVVQNTSFGSFVEIPVKLDKKTVKVEGLVHLSELSWDKVKDASSVLNPGDKVKVKVLGLRDGKLALSLKQAQDDPWKTIGDKYKKDDRVKGTIVRHSDFGVFVQLEPGIEGLIHITKIAPGTKLETGQEVNCYIEEIDPRARKISLGMVLTAKPVNYR